MKNSLIRVLISLFLCCCLVLNVVSLPARALDPVTVGFVGVTAVVGVACIMQALGYMASSNSEPFTNTVNACADYLTESTSFVTNGMLTFAGFRNGQLSSMYAMRDLVQEVWQWFFDTNAVYVSGYRLANTLPSLGSLSYSSALSYASQCKHCFSYILPNTDNVREIVAFSGGSYTYDPTTKDLLIYASGTSIYFWNDDTGNFQKYSRSYNWAASNAKLVNNAGQVATTQDVTLGQIQSPYQTVGTDEEIIEIEIAPVYIDLTKEVQEFPDPNNPSDDPDLDKKIPWLPIRIPSKNYDDTVINQTQQESWTGESDVEFEFDYGDSSGNGSGDGSGNTGTNTGTNFLESLTQFFTPSGDITMYSLDLKELFPFCIPFDIYNFLAALSADPVAPVFEFDLNLGVATEPMKIDLSNWSDLAAIIRTLELGLFCVGLALKTRELIGG